MTHFDFKCLLPALLHVEDRMSMAHGLESRVPLLDHPLVEFAATAPADVKFEAGNAKHLLKRALGHELPERILNRRDKMGFPVPLKEWFGQELREFVQDLFRSQAAQSTCRSSTARLCWQTSTRLDRFSRKTWGLISLEIWHQLFHDQAARNPLGFCCYEAARFNPRKLRSDLRKAWECCNESVDYRRQRPGWVARRGIAARLAVTDVLAIDNFATGRRDNLDSASESRGWWRIRLSTAP